MLFHTGKDIKKRKFQKDFELMIKSYASQKKKTYDKRKDGDDVPLIYPDAIDDYDKLKEFLKETKKTIDWIFTNWLMYRPGKKLMKKSLEKMWEFASLDLQKIIDDFEVNLSKNRDNQNGFKKLGLTGESLQSKLVLVDFGHIEMLLAFEDYSHSNQLIKMHSKTSTIAKRIGTRILKIRKIENQTASSKWLDAAIIIIGSILDALGIKSPITEFLEMLSLSKS